MKMSTTPVTIIDSGIYRKHIVYDKYKFRYNQSLISDKFKEKEIYYYSGKKGDYIDDRDGHGTAVTYIVSKTTDRIIFYDVSYGKLRNVYRFDEGEIFRILERVYQMGSRIVVMSFGARKQDKKREDKIDQFIKNHADMNIFIAAGNRPGFSSINSPANSYNVITVGAGVRIKNNLSLASFSANGPSNFDNIKPDVIDQSIFYTPSSYRRRGREYRKGSSFSNAFVAGKAAKIISDIKEKYPGTDYIPTTLVKAILIYSSKRVERISFIREVMKHSKIRYEVKQYKKDIPLYQQGNGFNVYRDLDNICFKIAGNGTTYVRGNNRLVAVYLEDVEQEDTYFDIKVDGQVVNPIYKYNVKRFELGPKIRNREITVETNLEDANIALVYGCRKEQEMTEYSIVIFLNIIIIIIVIIMLRI
jgi:subtilisin family serine protease